MASILIRAEGTSPTAIPLPVSSNRYFFAGRAGAMESPTRAVVEPAETKARVAPKQVADCGAYQVCHSGRSLRLLTEFAFANSQKIDYWRIAPLSALETSFA